MKGKWTNSVSPKKKKDFDKNENKKKKKRKKKHGVKSESKKVKYASLGAFGKNFLNFRMIMSIILVISLSFLGTILVVGGIIAQSISISNLVNEKNAITSEFLREQTQIWLEQGEKINKFIENYLRTHEDELEASGWLDNSSMDDFQKEIAQFFLFLTASKNKVKYAGVGTPSGTLFVGEESGEFFDWTNSSLKQNPVYCNYTEDNEPSPVVHIGLDDDLNIEPKEDWDPTGYPYDFRCLDQGWYQIGSKNEGYNWANFITTHGEITTTLVKKWYDSKGVYRGVIANWFLLKNFQEFLDTLSVALEDAKVFIVDKQNEYLIASNTDAKIVKQTATNDTINQKNERIKPWESENIEIASLSSYLHDKYSWKTLESFKKPIPITTPKGIKLATVETLNVTGFELAFVVYYDYIETYSAIFITIGVSILIGFIVIIVSSIVLIFVFIRLFHPLMKLINEMEKVKCMQLDDIMIKPSILYEIRMIQTSFLYTVKKLKKFKSFLPANIIQEENLLSASSLGSAQHKSNSVCSESTNGSEILTNTSPYQLRSSSSYENTSSSNIALRDDNRFGVNLEESMQNLLVIFFKVKPAFIKRKKSMILNFIGEVFDFVVSVSSAHGKLVDYGLEKIVLSVNSPQTLCNIALKLRHFFLNKKTITEGIVQVKIIGHRALVFSGNIGSTNLKKSVLAGTEFDQINEFYKIVQDYKSLDIFFSSKIEEFLDEEYVKVHVDFIKGTNESLYSLYYLVNIKEQKSDEWLYELAAKEKTNSLQILNSAFKNFLDDDLFEAIVLAEQFLEGITTAVQKNQNDKISEELHLLGRKIRNQFLYFKENNLSFQKARKMIDCGSLLLKPIQFTYWKNDDLIHQQKSQTVYSKKE